MRLHYELEGPGPPVVLLHSFPFDSRVWVSVGCGGGLVEDGRQAVLLDRSGQALSEKPRSSGLRRERLCA